MTTTFSFPKLAYGFALAATLVSGGTAHAQFRPPHISAPRPSAPHVQPQSHGPALPSQGGFGLNVQPQSRGPALPSQGGFGLTDPSTGGNSSLAGRQTATSFTNSAYNGGNFPQGGYSQQPQQGYYQQPQQGYYQQPQQTAYQPSDGQRYQLPAGYQGYAAGSVINYGGATYTVAGDGTMTTYSRAYQGISQPAAGQRYQVPAGYEGYAAGSVINYGGASYVVNGDGTMTAYSSYNQ